MDTITTTIKREWLREIVAGRKKVEYRDIKPYWIRRWWRSEVFGTHKPFSIMNYGNKSKLTRYDKSDLKRLYQKAWSGELTEINGTPIRLVKPFSTTGA